MGAYLVTDMTSPTSSPRVASLILLASVLLAASALPAQVAARSVAPGRGPPDTVAILASARPEIDAANAAWFPGLQRRDAGAIAAAYADSGLFVAADGAVTRGRAAITRMYAERFPRLRPIRAGAVVQGGLVVIGPIRVAEWGHGWIELTARSMVLAAWLLPALWVWARRHGWGGFDVGRLSSRRGRPAFSRPPTP